MDPETFDALVRRAAGLRSRRWMISIASSLFPLTLVTSQLDVEARKKHGHDRHDRVEANKRKKKKKKKRKPTTPPPPPGGSPPSPSSPPPPCANLQQTCSNNCCRSLGCGNNGCDPSPVCFQNPGGACSDSCDCRVDLICSDRHRDTCQNCAVPQEACAADDDCCFNNSTCGDNGCDGDPVCCQGQGAECFGDCDCCAAYACSDRQDFTCQDCAGTRDVCASDEDCCYLDQACGHNSCDGVGSICCGSPGAFCNEACDCCGALTECGDNGCDIRDACARTEGGECVAHCDCLFPFNCDERLGDTCQTCGLPQDTCASDDDCCLISSGCGTNSCGEDLVCCQQSGQLCFNDCDCCDELVCDTDLQQCVANTGMAASDETMADGKDADSASAKARWSRSGSTSARRTAAVAPVSPALIKQRSRQGTGSRGKSGDRARPNNHDSRPATRH